MSIPSYLDYSEPPIKKQRKKLTQASIGKKTKKPKTKVIKIDEDNEYVEIEANTQIIRGIANDMELPIYLVEDVVKSMGEFTANTIRTGDLEGVMWPYLGKFQVKPYSIQYNDFLKLVGKDMKVYVKKNRKAAEILFDAKIEDDDQS